ncbi:MAG: sulfatase, partial [Rhodopirellula sp.]|nr:sulfatase [Rhodopirellula sp.]
LYNIANDIGEKHDVSDENPLIVKELATLMEREHVPSELFPLIPLDAPVARKKK